MSEKNKHRVLLVLIALTTVPFFGIVNRPLSWSLHSDNVASLAMYVSAVLGYVGVSLLVWELVLGTRAVSGLFFSNLVDKLRLHRLLGTYGTALVLLHPLFVMYGYGESLLYVFKPDFSSGTETAVTYGRFALFFLLLIWITSVFARSKIAYRPWKYVHYVSYPLLYVSFLHVPDIGSSFHGVFVQFYWYTFVCITLFCVLLRMRHIFGFGKVSYTIVQRYDPTDDVTVFKLRAQEKNLHIKTGQYIYIQPNLLSEEHPFTVLDHDRTKGEIDIALKRFGSFTAKLQQLNICDTLLIDGPYGNFTQDKMQGNKPTVYIAGGIGVTPFVRYSLHSRTRDDNFLFYANQNRHTAVFRDILKHSLKGHYVDIFSREQRLHAEGNVEYGHISSSIIKKYVSSPEQYYYYICGPVGMIHAAKESLRNLGVPVAQVHAEEFGF